MDAITISNLALVKIGSQVIISFNDGTTPSRLCNLLYPITVNEVLRLNNWSWAKGLATLTQTATPPAIDWSYSYALPTDFSRILEVNDFGASSPHSSFEIIGNLLYSDDASVSISYIKTVTDPNLFDDLAVEVISTRLAQKLAKPLGGSETLEQRLGQEFQRMLEEARRIDCTSSYPRRKPQYLDSALVQARYTDGYITINTNAFVG
jgi:hypothetical protein